MSNQVKVVLNKAGVRELLLSPETAAMCQGYARSIVSRCGAGYATDTKQMQTRTIASVYTDTNEAKQDNLDNNTILRALR